jgi:hypothetical protein
VGKKKVSKKKPKEKEKKMKKKGPLHLRRVQNLNKLGLIESNINTLQNKNTTLQNKKTS